MKELEIKDLIIDIMKAEDVHEASLIEEEAFSMPWKESDFLEMIMRPYAHYFVARNNGQIVGICGILDMAGEGDISNVAVSLKERGRGIAQKMLQYAIDECIQIGMKEFTLEVRVSNIPAIRLYEKLGFDKEGIRPKFYEKPVEDALIMRLKDIF